MFLGRQGYIREGVPYRETGNNLTQVFQGVYYHSPTLLRSAIRVTTLTPKSEVLRNCHARPAMTELRPSSEAFFMTKLQRCELKVVTTLWLFDTVKSCVNIAHGKLPAWLGRGKGIVCQKHKSMVGRFKHANAWKFDLKPYKIYFFPSSDYFCRTYTILKIPPPLLISLRVPLSHLKTHEMAIKNVVLVGVSFSSIPSFHPYTLRN